MQLPEPQSHSLAIPSLDTAVRFEKKFKALRVVQAIVDKSTTCPVDSANDNYNTILKSWQKFSKLTYDVSSTINNGRVRYSYETSAQLYHQSTSGLLLGVWTRIVHI